MYYCADGFQLNYRGLRRRRIRCGCCRARARPPPPDDRSRGRDSGTFLLRSPLEWFLPCAQDCRRLLPLLLVPNAVENDSLNARGRPPHAHDHLRETASPVRTSWNDQGALAHHRWRFHRECSEGLARWNGLLDRRGSVRILACL